MEGGRLALGPVHQPRSDEQRDAGILTACRDSLYPSAAVSMRLAAREHQHAHTSVPAPPSAAHFRPVLVRSVLRADLYSAPSLPGSASYLLRSLRQC